VIKALRGRSAAWVALVLASAATLIVLAVLQYRWISEVREADLERIQISMDTAVGQFLQDYYAELLPVCLAFRAEPRAADRREWDLYAERYDDWLRTARRPQLVAGLHIWVADSRGKPLLLRLNPDSMRMEPAPWPAAMQPLAARLAAGLRDGRQPDRPNARLFAWTMDERIPALVRPLARFSPPAAGRQDPSVRIIGHVIVGLNREYLRAHLLPELVARHFGQRGGLAYRVEIADPDSPGGFLYRSDPSLAPLIRERAAVCSRLIGPARPDVPGLPPAPPPGPPDRAGMQPPGPRGAPLILPDETGPGWLLLVEPRAGSVASIAASLRRRDLALSTGVLLLLAVSMALVIVFSQRAQRLARLQMDFVAGVSHELRTPLAVICSAAENLADGVVETGPPVRQYGELIRNEGRRLGNMVEQILLFSAGPGKRYRPHPVDVGAVVAAALAEAASGIESAGFRLEKKIDPEMPPALADETALKQCLHNLISNAIKYGEDGRWLGVSAMVVTEAAGPEIQVTVEDHGPGIDPGELEQIFEPFYRGRQAHARLAHGTGLGLSLTRQIIEAAGGSITVRSTPGRGSAFTLHLPIAWP
jgi:signal transduction histidine kinase